jgi:class 3 adenylate cyclase
MAACPSCGKDNEAGACFCSACGVAARRGAATRGRKTVTVLFCAVAGSTALRERLDPEATRALMARYFETHAGSSSATAPAWRSSSVTLSWRVFGIPRVHEDDALRAARAALELRDSIKELELRIGVNTGEVVAGSGETLVTGDAVNVAARLEQAAEPSTILLGERTYPLVRDAVEAEPVAPVVARGNQRRFCPTGSCECSKAPRRSCAGSTRRSSVVSRS